MKILYYNWVDYLDPEKRGGGVTIYQRNLIDALQGDREHDVYFLSSGISFDILRTVPRWSAAVGEGWRTKRRRFEIVNSGTLSPSHFSFGNESQVSDPDTEAAFFDFVRRHGPFDVIHFNNLEGLPANVLKIKEAWPQTRIVLSLHNYYPFCPQVNLWRKERENCLDYKGGQRCVNCLPWDPYEAGIMLAGASAYLLKRLGIMPKTGAFEMLFLPAEFAIRVLRKLARVNSRLKERRAKLDAAAPGAIGPLRPIETPALGLRRTRFVDLINRHCDKVLCVSGRVRELATHHGLDPALLETCYIGTAHAKKFTETQPRDSILRPDGTLSLGYLGYMRRDKGYFFLLKAIKAMPKDVAKRIRLVVCARKTDKRSLQPLLKLKGILSDVVYADGYKQEELDIIAEQIDVGVVPVLWEDNLPQVAIEMHARHVPLLTSDLGGAQELANHPAMVFPAGDVAGFTERLRAILDGEISPEAYWAQAMAPLSMEAHVEELLAHYRQDAAAV